MVFGLVLALIVIVIFMLWMAHSPHFGLTGKIIAIIALPFVGAIIGFLGDLGVASQSVEWFPVLWLYGGFIGVIASLVLPSQGQVTKMWVSPWSFLTQTELKES
ncbi:hypothetical protein A3O11_02255 [Ligilactobacillus aviarius]|uniref:hypothetical protein n=1 Tax=Ligilactobacillus aviarius TaxID=1606 RepID=UPI0007DA31FA|nr:hypothetical protein [Ligilactobacillus aviarius]OAQ03468.1 hypothetical protein A3O10_05840 [Ligilactobacillus aviarius]OAQ05760.1 hypothetical protein A3O11_02255 [Ligilactobacillus aviarius]OAS80060.1 hypothetical protein A3O18_04765 [Ligilactobacillus aviarius]PEG70407.1 hypothetical protein A3P04_06410 [Ligilactobacillus aviarius]PEG73598.1 hypothetical protein A3O82_05430 [Ligilactobacillus aviarius]